MMTKIKLAGYEFDGPYSDIENIRDEPGVYVVMSFRGAHLPIVLDIGTAGEGMWQDSQGLKRRLKNHSRKSCWEKHRINGKLAYAVLYIQNQEQRLYIEDQLRRKFNPPCGTTPPEPFNPL